jgi:glycosyltransferase involved in cell wall biosynthesis
MFNKYYDLKYTLFEILGQFYISPYNFFKKFLLFCKEKEKYKIYPSNLKKNIEKSSKKIIIVIDNAVPEYDLHAGARTIFDYLQLFKDMGFDVKFIPDDFMKREPYVSELEKAGIEVLYGKWCKKNYQRWIKNNANQIHFVMLNRPRSIKYVNFLKKYTKAKIIYYGMDMYFVRELNKYNIEKNKAALRASQYYKIIELFMYNNSDIILTVSNKEKTDIKTLIKKDTVYTFPCFFYKKFKNEKYIFEERKNLIFVGGQKHPPNEDAVIWFCTKIMPKITTTYPDLRIYIVGKYSKNFIDIYSSKNVEFKGNISDNELNDLYLSSRMAVIPLRYGAGVKGKTIEAFYNGIPIITTDYGIEGLSDINDFTLLANDAQKFSELIIKLYNDKDILINIHSKSLKYIQTHFSYEHALKTMSKILN